MLNPKRMKTACLIFAIITAVAFVTLVCSAVTLPHVIKTSTPWGTARTKVCGSFNLSYLESIVILGALCFWSWAAFLSIKTEEDIEEENERKARGERRCCGKRRAENNARCHEKAQLEEAPKAEEEPKAEETEATQAAEEAKTNDAATENAERQ